MWRASVMRRQIDGRNRGTPDCRGRFRPQHRPQLRQPHNRQHLRRARQPRHRLRPRRVIRWVPPPVRPSHLPPLRRGLSLFRSPRRQPHRLRFPLFARHFDERRARSDIAGSRAYSWPPVPVCAARAHDQSGALMHETTCSGGVHMRALALSPSCRAEIARLLPPVCGESRRRGLQSLGRSFDGAV
ncbi:hypothetical protein PAN31117_05063 [Pandoraea anapnoica]|uniref:Uncharacterized protein n=1 Tax=Pandoraea anapnoica TaxID=2508301 RepID=A0A5E5AP12_9BURK|nr:hypothetical protein PIN31009_05337 [Pandoraea iniqua]VVE75028.1 hypothetical protein PAN31117_05063 [Pandoraea anapnoica]